MADQKISELTALTGANLADVDAFAVVDTSAVQTKKITYAELKTALDTGTGFVRITGDTMTGNLSFGDNNKVILGASSDLQIYHDGHSRISDEGTGNLILKGSSAIVFSGVTNEHGRVTDGGGWSLGYNGSTKLATTATGINVTGVITTDGMTTSADVNFGDNDKAIFGAGSDLKIYHDGFNNYIEGQTGSMIIQNTLDDFNVIIKSDNGSGGMADYFRAKGDTGSALMYHYGSEKLATTSTGIDVTGTVTMDGGSTSADFSFGDSDKAIFGAGSDLQIYHDGLNSIVADAGTGQLRLLGDDVRIYNAAGTEISAQFIQDGEARLKYNNSTKLATKTGGIEVTGTVTADGLTVDGTSAGTLNIVNFLNTDTSANQTANRLGLGISNSAGANYTYIEAKETGVDAFAEMNFYTGSTTTKRLTLSDNGDISFYNDSAAQGLFWDSSASRLGLGTTALSEGVLTVKAGGTNYSTSSIILEDSDSTTKSYLTHVNGTLAVSNSTSRDDFLIDSSGAATFGGTVTASGLITATAGINLPTVNTYITGNGHNVLQVDGTRTYFYGGTNGVQFRTADNASGLVDITNTGNIKINSGNLQIKTTGQIEDNGTRLLLRSTGDASGLRFDGGNYTPFKNGSESNGTVDLGYSGAKFKDLHLSGNANVGANVTAGSATAGVVTVGSANGFEMQKSGVNAYINQSDSGPIIVRMGSGYSEKLRIDSAGTLFLGTTTPTLHSSMTGIVLDNGSLLNETARGASKSLTLAQNLAIDSGNTWAYLSTDEGSYYQQFNGNHYFGTTPSGTAGADATVTSRLTILNGGRVGIGTSSPSFENGGGLEVNYSAGLGSHLKLTDSASGSGGTNGFDLYAFNTSGYIENYEAGNIVFRNNGDERMRLDSSGNLLVGTTSSAQPNENYFQARDASGFQVAVGHANTVSNGQPYFYMTYNGLGIGSITQASGSSVAYNTSSDYRLKENVSYTWDATTRLKQLKPARFNFIADDTNTLVDGFLAHEVSSVVPEAITGTKDAVDADGNPEYQGIDQSKLVPLLIKTIQELEARITALEA